MSSLNYLSWSLLPSMKKTGVSSRHLTQLRICRGAFLGKKKLWHSLAYGQLLIGGGCPLVCHTISWSRSCALQWPWQSAWESVHSWRGTKPGSICHCAVTPRPVFLQTHLLLIVQNLFRKKTSTVLDKIFHPWQNYLFGAAGYAKHKRPFCIQRNLPTGPVPAVGVRLTSQAQMNHLGRAVHLSMADSLHLLVESKHDWSAAVWMHQVSCVCITDFSAKGIPREILI